MYMLYRLSKHQFIKQIDFIYDSLKQFYIDNDIDFDDHISLQYEPLNIDVEISLNYDNIWNVILVFIKLLCNNASITNITYLWGLSYPTIVNYVQKASVLIDYFYQEYWTHDYWTPERLKNVKNSIYNKLYVYTCLYVYN